MELSSRLAIDAGLIISLILLTFIGNILVCFIWMELGGLSISLKSLSFELGTIFIGIPSFSPVIVTSYFCGNAAYNVNEEFSYSDTILISVCCFIFMFIVMGGLKISEDMQKSEEYRKQGLTHYSWGERIDESLTPAVIIALFIISGLILSCYFNGLN